MAYYDRTNGILRDHVKRAYENRVYPESWRSLPEFPNKEEILPPANQRSAINSKPEEWNEYQKEPVYDENLPRNIVDAPWPSKEDYIGAHYQILREDTIASLRRSVASFRRQPSMMDDNDTCIYTHVRAPNKLAIQANEVLGYVQGFVIDSNWCCFPS